MHEQKIREALADPSLVDEQGPHRDAVLSTLSELNTGQRRVATPEGDDWVVHDWVQAAINLYFRVAPMARIEAGELAWFDKIPPRNDAADRGLRAVPLSLVRYGAFVEPGAVLMPCLVNIGARVGTGSMIDTWATVGSCAQIGKNVHLSGGVGIGGVLEPIQAAPVIIEDNVFVGSRSIVVEGVKIEEEAVLGANVVLTASTKIIDVSGKKSKEFKGIIPSRSVVIPGSIKKDFPSGEYSVPCALIIGKRKESTDKKTSLNDALRTYNVAV